MRPMNRLKKLAWIAVALVLAVGVVLAQDLRAKRGNSETELAFFFSDSTKDLETASRTMRALRAKNPSLRIRPVFLVEDFESIAKPTDELAAAIRELKYAIGEEFSLRIYDEDGLALARDLKIDRMPAFAVIVTDGDRRKAWVAYGARANLEELLKCGK